MGCCLCSKDEKNRKMDEGIVFLCGSCTSLLTIMDSDKIKNLIGSLYLKNRVETAEFIESITGKSSRDSNTKLKVRTVAVRGSAAPKPKLILISKSKPKLLLRRNV